ARSWVIRPVGLPDAWVARHSLSHVERDDAAGEQAVRDPREAGRLETGDELVGAGEAADAGREVRVRRAAREHLPERWDDRVEPELVERGEHAARSRDLEDPETPAGAEHPPELAETGVEVGDVAHSEAHGSRVEAPVAEGKGEHVALDPLELRRLCPRSLQHRLREVEAGDDAAAARG